MQYFLITTTVSVYTYVAMVMIKVTYSMYR